MISYSVVNHKGGTGKTTLAIHLGAAIAQAGKRVLLIDADPQADLTYALGFEMDPAAPSTAEVIRGSAGIDTAAIQARENIDLLGGDIRLADLERLDQLTDTLKGELRRVGRKYAYCLIDTPPAFGFLNLTAIQATDGVICPVVPDDLSVRRVDQVARAAKEHNSQLRWIVPGNTNLRRSVAQVKLDQLRKTYGKRVSKTFIRPSARLAECSIFGKTIFELSPKCNAALDFKSLAKEVINAKQ